MGTSKPQPPAALPDVRGRLDSWKEIAAYLKRDARTVRRWEAEGLPIHRKVHNKQASVFAYRAELDAWWNNGREILERRGVSIPFPVAPHAEPERFHWKRVRTWGPVLGGVVIAACVLLFGPAGIRNRIFAWRAPPIRSIAVLPLRNLSGTTDYDYVADGLTEELTTRIARIPSLRVVSSTSVRQFRDTTVPLPQIAHQLNIDAVIEGSVVRSGNRIRITTQLVDARTDSHLWAQSYERDLGEILEIQDSATLDIANQVRVTLTPGQRQPFEARRPVVPDAYEPYLKGIYFQNRQTPGDVRSAVRFYEEAINEDPTYAAAYARLADSFMFLGVSGEISAAEASSRAQKAAEKALSLDETLEDAHADMANIAFYRDWDWKKAEAEYKRAIELNPNSARVHQAYVAALQILGRANEAETELQTARALDPVSVPSLILAVFNSYLARRYDEAFAQARTMQEVYPDAPLLHVFLGNLYFQQRQFTQAGEEYLRAEELWPASPERTAALSAALKAGGLKGFLRKRIELNKKQLGREFEQAYDIAVDCAAIGDADQAIYWLEKAYRVRDPKLPVIGAEPIFDSVRSDPRLADLVHRIGLPLN